MDFVPILKNPPTQMWINPHFFVLFLNPSLNNFFDFGLELSKIHFCPCFNLVKHMQITEGSHPKKEYIKRHWFYIHRLPPSPP